MRMLLIKRRVLHYVAIEFDQDCINESPDRKFTERLATKRLTTS